MNTPRQPDTNEKNPIDVVVGVIIRDNRMLLVQRLVGKEFEWMWECPGGKVEPGERHDEALLRELKEEIDLSGGVVGERLFALPFDPPLLRRSCILFYYPVTVPADYRAQSLEGMGFGWFTDTEAKALTLAPGNRMLRRLWVRPYSRNGCCADRRSRDLALAEERSVEGYLVCDESTCMELPKGASCSTCAHERRCVTMFGAEPQNTSCGFFPRRFVVKKAAGTEITDAGRTP